MLNSGSQSGNSTMSPSAILASEKGLPANIDAEKFILGSLLLDDSRFIEIAGILLEEDFALEKHRRIFRRMSELHDRGEKIDRVTVANELLRRNELESIDGLSYLVSLDDGLPHIANLDSYVRIIRDKATLRRIAMASQHLLNRAMLAEEDPTTILAGAEETLLRLGENRGEKGLMTPLEVIQGYEGGLNAFLDPSKRIKGISTGFTKLDEMTSGLHSGELIILAARPSMGKTALALNMAWHIASRLFQPVAIFSLEMSQESLLTRMLCAAARVDSQRFRAGYLNEQERQKLRAAANQMVEAPLFIDDTAGANLMDMHAKLRKLKQQQGSIGMVVVDYLPLMSIRGRTEKPAIRKSASSRAGSQTDVEGTRLPVPRSLSVKPRHGNPPGRSSPAAFFQRSPRIGFHRAGCRRGWLHLPPGEVYSSARSLEDLKGNRGTDFGQAAQRARSARSIWYSCTRRHGLKIAPKILAISRRKSRVG